MTITIHKKQETSATEYAKLLQEAHQQEREEFLEDRKVQMAQLISILKSGVCIGK